MSQSIADPLSSLASWLRCTVCGEPLEPAGRLRLACGRQHSFDVNKRGYVSLLAGGTRFVGDSAAMLDARDSVLESGTYAALSAAVARSVSGTRILDAGAGTGYYLRAALNEHPDARGLAMDLSPAAVGRASRSSDRIDGLVADTWQPLPVRTDTADSVLDVFAPRNLPEFHRVLRPGGTLVVAVPRADHLAELRATGTMLDVPADKADDLITAAAPLFALQAREHVTEVLTLTDDLRAALIGMGPSAHHAPPSADAAAPAGLSSAGSNSSAGSAPVASATLSVDVLRFTRAE